MQQADLTSLLNSLRAVQEPPRAPQPESETAPVEIAALTQSQLLSLLSSISPAVEAASAMAQDPFEATPSNFVDPIPPHSFAHSLATLSDIAQQEEFHEALYDMQREQNDQELRLKDARNAIVTAAQSTAKDTKLQDFDHTALERWQKLRTEQAVKLQALGCPVALFENGKQQRALVAVLLALMDE